MKKLFLSLLLIGNAFSGDLSFQKFDLDPNERLFCYITNIADMESVNGNAIDSTIMTYNEGDGFVLPSLNDLVQGGPLMITDENDEDRGVIEFGISGDPEVTLDSEDDLNIDIDIEINEEANSSFEGASLRIVVSQIPYLPSKSISYILHGDHESILDLECYTE